MDKKENNKISVLVLSHMFPTAEDPVKGIFVLRQVQALRRFYGVDVRVIAPQPYWITDAQPKNVYRRLLHYRRLLQGMQWEEYEGVPVLYVPYVAGEPLFPQKRCALTYAYAVKRALRITDMNFSLIHAHSSFLDGNAARKMAQRHRVPYVITEHQGPFKDMLSVQSIKRKLMRAVESARLTLGVSEAQQAAVQSVFAGRPDVQRSIRVLHNGIDVRAFPVPGPLAHKKTRRLLFVGALVPIKNVDVLLDAFALVWEQDKDTELYIAGDGPLKGALQEQALESPASGSIYFLGGVKPEHVAGLMRDCCDIFILPSRAETFGVVLLEAMASGKPCVATRNGGAESILTEPALGRLVPPDDAAALAQGIRHVQGHYEEYNSAAIRRFVEETFGAEKITAQLYKYYEEAVNRESV